MNPRYLSVVTVLVAACSQPESPAKSSTNSASSVNSTFDVSIGEALIEAHCAFLAACPRGDVVSTGDCVSAAGPYGPQFPCEVFDRTAYDACLVALERTCEGAGENYPEECFAIWDRSNCCLDDSECSADAPVCDYFDTQLCVMCRSSADCPSESPGCDGEGQCTSCEAVGAVRIDVDGGTRCGEPCESSSDCGSAGYDCVQGGCHCALEKKEVMVNGEQICVPECVRGMCDEGACMSGLCIPQ